MMGRIRILLRTSDNHKIGGVRQIYRHVDMLNQLGYDAAVVHPDKGFKCSWFENNTKTIGFGELSLDENDCMVLPELDQDLPPFQGSDKCKVVVLAQNPFGFLRGFGGVRNLFDFYKSRVSAVIVVSEHSRKHLQALLPFLKVYRHIYSFDKPPFSLGTSKEKVITFMPRRRNQEMDVVISLLQQTGSLAGWNIVPIIDMRESEVANVMRRASVFMASGQMEGFGMPAAEAMASGCVVAGFHGYGGEEVFKPEFSRPVPDEDVFAYVEAMREILAKDIDEINEMGRKASKYVLKEYSTERELESIKTAWQGIMGKEVTMIEPVKQMTNVAAYMMANEENAYIERIIRWIAPRVGKVFIVEGEKTYSGSEDRNTQIESLYKKLVASGITNIEHIVAKYIGTSNPAINETHMRNEALDAIQREGFEWIWIVDSDEVYSNADADRLWKYFFDNLRKNAFQGARCSWYTYWKSIHYRIDPPEPYRPNIILRSDQRFSCIRALADESRIMDIPQDVCMVRHYSWAKPPSEMARKIKAWGHAHQVLKGWYENVFEKWTPDCNMENLHPTEPQAYRRAIKCNLPMPELMQGHPYSELDIIDCDDHASPNIKVIILNHNKPENADKLYKELSKCFEVEIWDSGSDSDKIPINVTKSFPNIYWTGTWNEIMRTCSEYDAVWMIGCDIELKSHPLEYRRAIEASLPFGCWSPCVQGRAHPFMQAKNYGHNKPMSVRNIEGMAMAVSGQLMRKAKKLPEGSPIGFGQDFWLCYISRNNGMKNIIDGSVAVFHPEGIGYDEVEAMKQMESAFSSMYGSGFRQTIFQYDERYEANLMPAMNRQDFISEVVKRETRKQLTIVTVDNGWGYADFLRITSNFPEAKKIVMVKGVAELTPTAGVEIIKYDPELKRIIDADLAFFPKVGAANKVEYIKLLRAGIPMVVHVSYSMDMIEHMKNGFVYQEDHWAVQWLRDLMANEKMRNLTRANLLAKPPTEESPLEELKVEPVKTDVPVVTVITPTYHRNPDIIKRCIDCMKLQTLINWEQLICSDGEEEPQAKKAVEDAGDSRIVYHHTIGKKEGDYGNTVRKEMLERAKGSFVLFLDDDNIILPDYLSKMVKAVQDSGKDFAVCKVMHFGPLNPVAGKPPIVLEGNPVKLYHIDPLQILVKADVMKKIGWDTEVGYLSDGVTLEKLGNQFQHVRVEEVLGVHI